MLFPRLDRTFFAEMVKRCGELSECARGLLRTLVGFPELREGFGGGEIEHEASIALFGACGTGDLDLVKLLLQRDDVQLVAGGGPWHCEWTSAMYAAWCGHNGILRYIVDNPPASWSKDDADTTLIACAMADDVEYASRLLDAGAEPLVVRSTLIYADSDRSALRIACSRAHVGMVTLLLDATAKLTALNKKPFCEREDKDLGTCVLARTVYRWGKLSVEEDARRVEIVRLLLAAGATTDDAWISAHPLYVRALLPEGSAASTLAEAR